MIDLRSDTVTKPTASMLESMMQAQVGDDVFAEDPSIIELETFAAQLFGMEAALFCPSGTMTNQIAIKAHTQPGDELICDSASHIYNYEGGGIAFNSGVQAKLLVGNRGRLNASQIENAINPNFDWLCKTSLVCLENTVNRAGGSIYEISDIHNIKDVCLKYNLKLHLDGARLFNALVATNQNPIQYGALFDSISICLSKGLGAPVGSLLLGNHKFIKQSRRIRKVFGGGMRQAGILAAAGLFALKNNVNRLKEDHFNAKMISNVLTQQNYVKSVLPVETNILIFDLIEGVKAEQFVEKMRQNEILCTGFGGQSIRMVTHLDADKNDCAKVCEVLQKLKF
ncbi:MAG TPA: GntG family PLP-dependent aldolase [Bacteroidia bacterium]|nr:GntG family PLP-dependent aldolase [Bacteroidia bacterium]